MTEGKERRYASEAVRRLARLHMPAAVARMADVVNANADLRDVAVACEFLRKVGMPDRVETVVVNDERLLSAVFDTLAECVASGEANESVIDKMKEALKGLGEE